MKPLAPLPQIGCVRWFEPDEDLDDELVLSGKTLAAFTRLVEELRNVERFLRSNVDPPTRLLFSGPSGTGKTLAARWLGWKLRLPLAVLDVSATVGSTLGATSANLGEAFKGAASRRCVLFLDEVDGICGERGGGGGAADQELARATTTLLQQLDWLEPSRIVIAATNFLEAVDGALRRRLTTEIAFELPDRDARRRMLGRWLAKAPVPDEVLDGLAEEAEGLGGAELRSAAMAVARRAIMSAPDANDDSEPRRDELARGAQQVLHALGGLA